MSRKHLFLDVYNEYLLYAKKKQKEQSFASLKYKFNSHILPFFQDMYLEDISSKNILCWEEHILSLKFSNNYNKNLYYILSGFFEYCHIFYDFDKKIISNIGSFKKKYEENKKDFYNYKEFKRFIRCVDDEIFKQFFCLLFYTGVRPGEAMALKFKDIKNGCLTINKTINSHGHREIGTTKTNSSNRSIRINDFLEKDLLKLKRFYVSDLSDDLFVFGGQKPLSPTTINRHKLKACEKANIRPITLHQFRNSHATLLLQNGIMINEVSKRLGHSKVSTTLDIYSHTDLTQEKRVLCTLNSIRFNFFASLKYKFKSIIKRFSSL